MRAVRLRAVVTSLVLLAGIAASAAAQTAEPQTRATVVEDAEAQKATTLEPFSPSKAERVITDIENRLEAPKETWHPFFENAYRGGGFAPGLGYMWHVSPYDSIDFRGSYSLKSYKRAEAEFVAPRMFDRRGQLSILGGWRDATQVAFYGVGPDTSKDERANFEFEQPYGSALFTLWPTRKLLMVRGGVELSRWNVKAADDLFAPATFPALGTTTTYVHTQATVGFDWRTASSYSRRGGFYGVTAHDYRDRADSLGFREVDYEAVEHVPILRESWVLSFHGLAQTTSAKTGQEIPFFLMPSLGGGTSLRGYSSWRFRDNNSLLLQAEWRIMVNRFFDTAVFYDTGQVAAHTSDFDVDRFKSDYGFGVRLHTPFSTALRVDVARSREGTSLVFATSAPF